MTLPQWFVVGPQKTGSAWLRSCLVSHPDIAVPQRVNETFFFDRYFDRGTRWYEDYFLGTEHKQSVGEVAPTYFASPEAPGRIAATCPDARIITLFRNPVDRAWSMYRYLLQKGDTRAEFGEALKAHPTILSDGLYAQHLERFEQFFDSDHLLNLVHDDIIDDPHRLLGKVFNFLGVDHALFAGDVHQKVNEGKVPRSFVFSHLAHTLSRTLHRHRLHRIVNTAKGLGLKKLVLRSATSAQSTKMTEFDKKLCMDYFNDDVLKLSSKLCRDLQGEWFGTAARQPVMPIPQPESGPNHL